MEVHDLFGSLGQASDSGLVRFAVDRWGRPTSQGRVIQRLSMDQNEMQRHVGEGCNILGSITMESVPGSFFFLPGGSYAQLALFYPEHFINTSHTVHYLYFGDLPRKQVKHERIPIVLDSLHDHTRLVTEDESANAHAEHLSAITASPAVAGVGPAPPTRFHFSKSFEYYLKIVPTTFSSSSSGAVRADLSVHRRTPTTSWSPGSCPRCTSATTSAPCPSRSPTRYAPFSDFLVEVCAIVGGMVTVMKPRAQHGQGHGGATAAKKGGGQGADGGLWGGSVPFRYDALTVQAPEPVLPNGYGAHASDECSARRRCSRRTTGRLPRRRVAARL